ncbi:MAG: hypothetical protein AB7V58_05855 [Solirubrobacterales bacterium]
MPQLFSGLTVPRWWMADSGLILPSSVRDLHVQESPGQTTRFDGLLTAERHRPLGNVGVYATPEAMNIAQLPFAEFKATIGEVPLGMILPVICHLQAVLHKNGMDPRVQLGLAAGLFNGTAAFPPLARFIDSVYGERVAFCEQALTLLQHLTILNCEEEPTGLTHSEYAARIRSGIFFAPGFLESHGAPDPEDRGDWLSHVTQLFDFNGSPVFGNAMGRTWAIFGCLHREASDICPAVPLDKWLREDYGLGLEQQMSLGFVLYAHLVATDELEDAFDHMLTSESLGGIFGSLGFSEEERVAAEGLIAAPPSWFRDQVEGQSVEQLSWNRVPFMRRPFVRLPSGQYLLQSPQALMSWIADGIHYRCLDSAIAREAVSAYTTRLGKLTERYVLELVASAHKEPRLPGAGKVFGDKKFGRGIDSSDVTVTYPNEVILMEVASHRLTVGSRCDGDQEALEYDLKEMVGRRPKQLRRSIDAIKPISPGRAATLRFDRLDSGRIARFWPLIVTMTPIHWSPLLEEFLAPSLAELDGRNDVEALDVLAVEDLETLVAITEETGQPLADLLAAKQEAMGAHADVRTWISRDRFVPNIARPSYLDHALKEVMNVATRLLGLEGVETESVA